MTTGSLTHDRSERASPRSDGTTALRELPASDGVRECCGRVGGGDWARETTGDGAFVEFCGDHGH